MSVKATKLKKEDALKIPILDIGRIVVPQFTDRGSRSTGQCCKHKDEKLGNLRFRENKNYAHCFTCGENFDPISMVMDYRNLNFTEALEFLYDYFPNYFTLEDYNHANWTGLSTKDYRFLGISSQLPLGTETYDIRQFAKKFPKDHDVLLVSKVLKVKENLLEIKEQLLLRGFTDEKIDKDERKIEEKLFNLLKTGLISPDFKKNLSFETFKENLEIILKEKLEGEKYEL